MTTLAQPAAYKTLRTSPFAWPLRVAWRSLVSLQLALALILLLAIVIFAGTMMEQAPPSVVADPVSYAQWLDTAEAKYGGWTGTLERLELFNVFHAPYFRALLLLLAVNIIICTVNRSRSIWATVFRAPVRVNEQFLANARHHSRLEAPMPAREAAERLGKSLARAHYRVTTEVAEGSLAVLADKNRLSRFGTFFVHLSLVLILVGAMAGGIWGFEDPRFTVAEGSTRDLGLGTGISVRLDQFADEYYPDGSPRDFRSRVTLMDHGESVKTGVIRVNSPMRYNGVAFHQSFFGQAAVVSVRDESGAILFSDAVPLSWETGQGGRPMGTFTLPGQDIAVNVIGPPANRADPLIRAGELRVEVFHHNVRTLPVQNLTQGTPAQLGDLTFTFERETRYVGMKVVKDPGMTIVWVACAFMLAGLAMLFYLPRRRLWALCSDRDDGTSQVLVGMPAQRDVTLESEFGRLQTRIARALGIPAAVSRQEGDRNG
jgi:cytochrome c biogenesis protein